MSTATVDECVAQRADIDDADGAALRARLTAFLQRRSEAGQIEITSMRRLIGGYSRQMSVFTMSNDHGTKEYILRLDPPDLSTMLVTNREDEWQVLQALSQEGVVAVPTPRWVDATGEELGRPGIVMDRVTGRNLLEQWRDVPDEDRRVEDWKDAAEDLARFAASFTRSSLDRLPSAIAHPASWHEYMDDCSERWRAAEAKYPESAPFVRFIAGWLDAHRPEPAPLSLVHGDLQPNNIIDATDSGYLAVDWELAHIGDPREDLGWWLLCEASQHADYVSHHLDVFCAAYRDATGLTEEVINERDLRYFMVASSLTCYEDLLEQSTALTEGRTAAMGVAYIAVAMPFMHGVFFDAMTRVEALDASGGVR